MLSVVAAPVTRLTASALRQLPRTKNIANSINSPREFYTAAGPAKRTWSTRMLSTLSVLGRLFTRQANVYVYNRVRKAFQLHLVYRSAFGQRFFRAFTQNLLKRVARRRSPFFLLGASAFSFKEKGISDDDVKNCIEEFEILKVRPHALACRPQPSKGGHKSSDMGQLNLEKFKAHLEKEGFESIVDSERLHIWRKSEPGKPNYTYKVYGTFTDVPARAFFSVQCDTDYRKQWDKLVVQLDVIDSDQTNDVIYWHMHYPFPLSSRDYVFVRRSVIDVERACMVVVCHATTHEDCPPRPGVVRVDDYMSNMVISPHNSFDENGFDYLLTYYDDPQSSFPSPVYAWMAASGVHDYVDKLHNATKQLQNGCSYQQVACNRTDNSPLSNASALHFSAGHKDGQTQYA